jgi:hypothetical protein
MGEIVMTAWTRFCARYPSVARRLWRLPFSARLLPANPMFDAEWYLERYPDVREAGYHPYRHYLLHGSREGRDPNPGFDTTWYLAAYPDVRRSGVDPLDHYSAVGIGEGREPAPPMLERFGVPEITLLYLHIPKTGGTAVRRLLERLYPEHLQAFVYDNGEVTPIRTVEELTAEQRADIRLLFGHFRYGVHSAFPESARYISMVRDPIARIVSLYRHQRTSHRPQMRERLDGVTLEQFVLGGQWPQTDNGMVRMIAARPGVPFGACPDDLLDEAIQHVEERFAALLVLERPESSLRSLSHVLGVPMSVLPVINAAEQSDLRLDPALASRIAELNRLDIAFYRYAIERLSNPATVPVAA